MSEQSTPDIHHEHWMEPKALTETRAPEEKTCTSCGEDLPWHNNSCRLLKVAYTKRKSVCKFCGEMYQIGEAMYEHNTKTHMDKLEAMGVKLSKTPFNRLAKR